MVVSAKYFGKYNTSESQSPSIRYSEVFLNTFDRLLLKNNQARENNGVEGILENKRASTVPSKQRQQTALIKTQNHIGIY